MTARIAGGPPVGAVLLSGGRCGFRVWAPRPEHCAVLLEDGRRVELAREEHGYRAATLDAVPPGTRYRFVLDGTLERPDPASRSQPEGVHGPSAVVGPDFPWTDDGWVGPQLRELVLYELHVGTFTEGGTFDAVIPHLDDLRALGVTALELMPLAEFPGGRNWGYDGVLPFAVQHTYGGRGGLKRLVDACHQRGLAVVLDVVYNHLGPEGNHFSDFGPYYTDAYRTPWGDALNFDGPGSDEVRAYFLQNALQWVDEFHVDGLRLDAVHAIHDESAYPFLEELGLAVHERAAALGRRVHVIAESDANDPRLVRARKQGGLGLDGVWADDVHHALHALLTGERGGYYRDYGSLEQLATGLTRAFAFAGARSSFRGRRHGRDPEDTPPERFVVCVQNHDQVGNRARGDRLAACLEPAALRLAAAAVLLSPFTPLLFMGEEYGETAPFPYFVSHGDPELVEAVRRGRRNEFAAFQWQDDIPDPQAEETFRSARLRRSLAASSPHRELRAWHVELLRIRRELDALTAHPPRVHEVTELGSAGIRVVREAAGSAGLLVLLFGAGPLELRAPPGRWLRRLDSGEDRFGGGGAFAPERLEGGTTVRFDAPGPGAALWIREHAA